MTALTKEQYDKVMHVVWVRHRFGGPSDSPNCKCIKYVRPNWDMRDSKCFSIRFEGLFGTGAKVFVSDYDETESMYDRIMKWLDGPRFEKEA